MSSDTRFHLVENYEDDTRICDGKPLEPYEVAEDGVIRLCPLCLRMALNKGDKNGSS